MIRSKISRRSRRLVLALGALRALAALGCRKLGDADHDTRRATVPTTGLAVLNSDYSTTSLSLVDPTTHAVVHDDCVDSNTVPPTLSLALSGDVALPSHAQVGGDVRADRRREQRADLGRPADLQDPPSDLGRRLQGLPPRRDLGQRHQGVRDPLRDQPRRRPTDPMSLRR